MLRYNKYSTVISRLRGPDKKNCARGQRKCFVWEDVFLSFNMRSFLLIGKLVQLINKIKSLSGNILDNFKLGLDHNYILISQCRLFTKSLFIWRRFTRQGELLIAA